MWLLTSNYVFSDNLRYYTWQGSLELNLRVLIGSNLIRILLHRPSLHQTIMKHVFFNSKARILKVN